MSTPARIIPFSSCEDNPQYIDYFGLTCSYHKKYTSNCNDATSIGYPFKYREELKVGCMKTCGLCNKIKPSKSPTKPPVSKFNGVIANPYCKDMLSYSDKLGMNCAKYGAVRDCNSFANYIGFNEREIVELVTNCPKSCNLCDISESIKGVVIMEGIHKVTKKNDSATIEPSARTELSTKIPTTNPSYILSYGPSYQSSPNSFYLQSYQPSYQLSDRFSHTPYQPSFQPTDWLTLSPSDNMHYQSLYERSYQPSHQFPDQHSDKTYPNSFYADNCMDNGNFNDENGFNCEHFKEMGSEGSTVSCAMLSILGYDSYKAIQQNCPKSCKMCTRDKGSLACEDNLEFIDHLGLSCATHKYMTNCQQTDGYNAADINLVRLNCPRSCGLCPKSNSQKLGNLTSQTKALNSGFVLRQVPTSNPSRLAEPASTSVPSQNIMTQHDLNKNSLQQNYSQKTISPRVVQDLSIQNRFPDHVIDLTLISVVVTIVVMFCAACLLRWRNKKPKFIYPVFCNDYFPESGSPEESSDKTLRTLLPIGVSSPSQWNKRQVVVLSSQPSMRPSSSQNLNKTSLSDSSHRTNCNLILQHHKNTKSDTPFINNTDSVPIPNDSSPFSQVDKKNDLHISPSRKLLPYLTRDSSLPLNSISTSASAYDKKPKNIETRIPESLKLPNITLSPAYLGKNNDAECLDDSSISSHLMESNISELSRLGDDATSFMEKRNTEPMHDINNLMQPSGSDDLNLPHRMFSSNCKDSISRNRGKLTSEKKLRAHVTQFMRALTTSQNYPEGKKTTTNEENLKEEKSMSLSDPSLIPIVFSKDQSVLYHLTTSKRSEGKFVSQQPEKQKKEEIKYGVNNNSSFVLSHSKKQVGKIPFQASTVNDVDIDDRIIGMKLPEKDLEIPNDFRSKSHYSCNENEKELINMNKDDIQKNEKSHETAIYNANTPTIKFLIEKKSKGANIKMFDRKLDKSSNRRMVITPTPFSRWKLYNRCKTNDGKDMPYALPMPTLHEEPHLSPFELKKQISPRQIEIILEKSPDYFYEPLDKPKTEDKRRTIVEEKEKDTCNISNLMPKVNSSEKKVNHNLTCNEKVIPPIWDQHAELTRKFSDHFLVTEEKPKKEGKPKTHVEENKKAMAKTSCTIPKLNSGELVPKHTFPGTENMSSDQLFEPTFKSLEHFEKCSVKAGNGFIYRTDTEQKEKGVERKVPFTVEAKSHEIIEGNAVKHEHAKHEKEISVSYYEHPQCSSRKEPNTSELTNGQGYSENSKKCLLKNNSLISVQTSLPDTSFPQKSIENIKHASHVSTEICESNADKLLIEPKSFEHTTGASIKFTDSMNSSFKFIKFNPGQEEDYVKQSLSGKEKEKECDRCSNQTNYASIEHINAPSLHSRNFNNEVLSDNATNRAKVLLQKLLKKWKKQPKKCKDENKERIIPSPCDVLFDHHNRQDSQLGNKWLMSIIRKKKEIYRKNITKQDESEDIVFSIINQARMLRSSIFPDIPIRFLSWDEHLGVWYLLDNSDFKARIQLLLSGLESDSFDHDTSKRINKAVTMHSDRMIQDEILSHNQVFQEESSKLLSSSFKFLRKNRDWDEEKSGPCDDIDSIHTADLNFSLHESDDLSAYSKNPKLLSSFESQNLQPFISEFNFCSSDGMHFDDTSDLGCTKSYSNIYSTTHQEKNSLKNLYNSSNSVLQGNQQDDNMFGVLNNIVTRTKCEIDTIASYIINDEERGTSSSVLPSLFNQPWTKSTKMGSNMKTQIYAKIPSVNLLNENRVDEAKEQTSGEITEQIDVVSNRQENINAEMETQIWTNVAKINKSRQQSISEQLVEPNHLFEQVNSSLSSIQTETRVEDHLSIERKNIGRSKSTETEKTHTKYIWKSHSMETCTAEAFSASNNGIQPLESPMHLRTGTNSDQKSEK